MRIGNDTGDGLGHAKPEVSNPICRKLNLPTDNDPLMDSENALWSYEFICDGAVTGD